ncbi:uncharacterized protein LDX57_005560 [Aspergillus melleus]|uniref:uncharacterized protein n=1 Tax=Aspergillus melleus TaxID=138277 RepID=UPI001E8CCCD5|nr:uncharacterized protein LDX57_005560 [Aspergillus melleus]KAH8427855.1 hypothetical protein LDX57_005560 [Aspergillus melleus]
MAGSRSAGQRNRRRDTTSRAVDFLNNIHSPTDRVSHSSPVRPRRSSRHQTERTKQGPQSDGILGSPQSSEEGRSAVPKPVLQSEPVTPGENENTQRGSWDEKPPRSQPNIHPVIEVQIGRESSHGSSDDNSDQGSGEDSELEDPSEVAGRKARPGNTKEELKEIEINHEDRLAELSLTRKPDKSFSFSEDDDSENDSEDIFHDSSHKQEGNPSLPDASTQDRYEEVNPTRVILFPSDSDEDDDERDAREFSPSQQLQQEQEMNASATDGTKDAATLELEPEPNVDGEPEDAADESEYSPSKEDSASEGSPAASDLFRYTPEGSEDGSSPAASPKDRSRPGHKTPVVEIPAQQRTSSISSRLQDHHNSTDDGSSSFASARSTETSRHEGESSWFTEAKMLGGQKKNWEILVSETLAASELVKPSRAHYFQKIETLMMSLRKEYAGVLCSLEKQRQPSQETRKKCERLRRSLDDEGDKLREMIYYRAARRDEQHKSLGGELAEEFEARVYYPLVRLILQCFKAYRRSGMHQRFQWPYDHLLQIMKLLQKFCTRSNAQQARGYVAFRCRGWSLISILNNLIEALETGALRGHVPTAASGQREWTDDEGYALLEGLKRWQGPERYHQILEQFPSQLGGRTIGELRAKAQQIHDTWVSHYEKTATTREQRREWQWLMEV